MNGFSHKMFIINAVEKTLTAELSDLGKTSLSRVWPDACDIGLTLIGHISNIDFVVDKINSNNEQELVSYELIPTPDSLRKTPQASGWRMILFND